VILVQNDAALKNMPCCKTPICAAVSQGRRAASANVKGALAYIRRLAIP
jgi:hypothetical protein